MVVIALNFHLLDEVSTERMTRGAENKYSSHPIFSCECSESKLINVTDSRLLFFLNVCTRVFRECYDSGEGQNRETDYSAAMPIPSE